MRKAMELAAAVPQSNPIVLYKNNTDNKGASYGCHENFLVARAGEASRTDVGWSLVRTRSVFEHRAVVAGCDREELLAGLEALASGEAWHGAAQGVNDFIGVVVATALGVLWT